MILCRLIAIANVIRAKTILERTSMKLSIRSLLFQINLVAGSSNTQFYAFFSLEQLFLRNQSFLILYFVFFLRS